MKSLSYRLVRLGMIIAGLLSIPLIAMQFTQEVQWDLPDFVIMGSVLLMIGLVYEMVASRSEKTLYRAALAVGLLGAFLLFWVNAAVGIIGNEGHPANLLFVAPYLAGFSGAILSRLRAKGMALTLAIMAVIQLFIPLSAPFFWPSPELEWAYILWGGSFLVSVFFALMFAVSAILFRRAITEE